MPLLANIKKYLTNQRGDVVIIWSIFMLILMSFFVALVVETGDLMIRKHMVQAAADASALSGASAVESIANFNPATMLPAPHPDNGQVEHTVLKTTDTGGGDSWIYARQILDHNKALMEFDRKGIKIHNVTINGVPRDAFETSAGNPINITDMDGTIKTYYRNFNVVLNGYMDAPLWGALFGNDKAYFSIPAGATPQD